LTREAGRPGAAEEVTGGRGRGGEEKEKKKDGGE